jgi:nicotinate dehydrogenase subunit B
MLTKTRKQAFGLSRRDFFKTGGALVVTFTLGAELARGAVAAASKTKSVALDQVDGFLAVDAKGAVTVYSGKVDLGTGVRTALTQIAAEELSVPLGRVNVIEGDTALTPDQGPTFGSLSIQIGGMQIRQAAATARAALLAQAAAKLGVAADGLAIRDGVIAPKSGGKGVAYAELVGSRDFEMKVDPKAPLKDPKDYAIVGKSVARLDIPDKVTGRFTYMQDFKRPGMLHARVVRPRAIKASLKSWNDLPCRKIAGYVGMVHRGNFLAVLGRNEWAAVRASNAIEASWSDWAGLPDSAALWDHVRKTKINSSEDLQKAGNTAEALKTAAKSLSATYDFAIHTHGSMGPSCAVAQMKGGKLTVWTASQATHLLRKQIANMLQMAEADVRCIYIEGSGCYGRNGHEDAAADAALIARELDSELPVRVQWTRQDEHGWDPKGPPTLLDYRGGLDAGGNVVGWESGVFIPDRPKMIAVTLVAAELAGLPKEESHPGNIHQSLAIPYAIPNIKASAHWLAETPFRPSWIRTPGRMQNTFGNESFIDELAAAAGADPMEYRLRNLKDPRGTELLQRLTKLANWTPRPAGRQQGDIVRGRGVSYVKYELVRTYVGVVADVEVNRRTGAVKVNRFYVAHDCGQIINPDGLKNQIEGNVIQTVSRTLIEELRYDRSAVTSLDWASYPILTFPDAPEVVIDLIDRPSEKPWGAGEPTAAVVPSAIANAIYDASGARLRSVPFKPEKVLAALKAAGGG